MTVASTATFELTVDGLIRRSLQVAGLLNASQQASADDLALGHDLLNLELDELQAEGLVVRHVERTTLALVAGTAEYTLPVDTSDVFVGNDNMVGTIVPASGGETLVRAIRRSEYIAISNKTSQATPVLCYVERAGTVTVVFWPVPSATASFRYQRVRIPKDTSDGSKTAEIERRRQLAVVWSLAFALAVAKSAPLERCGLLKDERDRLREVARHDDVERGHGQLYISHYGGF